VVKRFLIWLDANDRLVESFQVGKAVNRLRATRGNRRSVKAGREPDPGLARIVTYYDEIPLPSPDEKRGQIRRLGLPLGKTMVCVWSAGMSDPSLADIVLILYLKKAPISSDR